MFSRLITSWAKKEKYPSLSRLMKVYFGHDFDSYGQNVDEIMQSFFDYTPGEPPTELKTEVSSLLQIEDDSELKAIMLQLTEKEFDAERWGLTWRSYLENVARKLNERASRNPSLNG